MGAAHVRGFAAEGAKVVIADLLEAEGETLARGIGSQALFQPLDVTREEQWGEAAAAADAVFGSISVLVNNAGVLRRGPIDEIKPADWRLVLEVNLTGVFLGIQAVAPSMRRAGGGAIVNVSSASGLFATSAVSAYTASKWAVRALTKSAALKLGRHKIRVNSVHPGYVDTPMLPAGAEANSQNLALPGVVDPDVITSMVLFVASDEASFSTGSEFVADGGMSLAGGKAMKA
ncbi:SDR family oxidoreductase [Bradyrhizobium sp. PMVTL-01]|uniref:SDR family oxidoreductase n=1 Tax=Bradyrhizobium sp. PMVTL-01 TaxID=3434999 RepID=UPI003F70D0FA